MLVSNQFYQAAWSAYTLVQDARAFVGEPGYLDVEWRHVQAFVYDHDTMTRSERNNRAGQLAGILDARTLAILRAGPRGNNLAPEFAGPPSVEGARGDGA